jgi:ornithine carbamoyltransferase
MPNLKGRSYINTLDFKPAELEFLLDRAKALKKARGKKGKLPLAGKSVAMVFFNLARHPRLVEVGIAEAGGQPSRCPLQRTLASSTARARVMDGIEGTRAARWWPALRSTRSARSPFPG